jgi:hypothetical protein
MRMLASSNSEERQLGLKIIDVLQGENKFSPDLRPLVENIKNESRPSDPSKQLATKILDKNGSATSTSTALKATVPQSREIYIQIAHEDQRSRAADLQASLQQAGFTVPSIDLVAHPTFNTYIRYFDASGKVDANKIDAIMEKDSFKPEIQDFTKTDSGGQTALEVWFGDKEPATVGGRKT